ncbi:MAG: hypothetical protein JNM07_06980 [Phycisphaerae bacterium]|nr:hypothetical protein [Phycisphaerae bacterium]
MSRAPSVQGAVIIDGRWLGAVGLLTGTTSVRVTGGLLTRHQPDESDADARTAWVIAALADQPWLRAGARVAAVLPRAHAALKRIEFPESVAANEVRSAVRLQMARQLSVSGEPAVDYRPLERAGAGRHVLAAAASAESMARAKGVAERAGFRVGSVGLSCEGLARLAEDRAAPDGAVVVAMGLTPGSVESVAADAGGLLLARSADIEDPSDDAATAALLAIEWRRTIMAVHATLGSKPSIRTLFLSSVGDTVIAALRRAIADPSLAFEVVEAETLAAFPDSMQPRDRTRLACVVASVLTPRERRLDFLHPRMPPDTSAARRRRVLMAFLIGVFAIGGLYTTATRSLSSARAELESVNRQIAALSESHERALRARLRVEHARAWTGARMDWLAHFRSLCDQLPPTSESVLDEITGRSVPEIAYAPAGGVGGKAWSTRIQAVIDVSGSAVKREVADALRARLVADDRYQIKTKGPDLPDRYALTLATDRPRPDVAPPAAKTPATSKEAVDGKKGVKGNVPIDKGSGS